MNLQVSMSENKEMLVSLFASSYLCFRISVTTSMTHTGHRTKRILGDEACGGVSGLVFC